MSSRSLLSSIAITFARMLSDYDRMIFLTIFNSSVTQVELANNHFTQLATERVKWLVFTHFQLCLFLHPLKHNWINLVN